MKIFINYKQNTDPDHALAKQLEEKLISEGHSVFRDESNIKASEAWPARLEKEVRACDSMVSLVSNKSLQSMWVLNEIDLAKKLNKMIVPVVLEEIEDSLRFQSLNPRFMSIQWIVLSNNWQRTIDEIAHTLLEPRHVCYKNLINDKLEEYNITGEELIEALLSIMYQSHWPAVILSLPSIAGHYTRLNGEQALSLAEAIRNQAESFANMKDHNAVNARKEGDSDAFKQFARQKNLFQCLADTLDTALDQWSIACVAIKEELKQKDTQPAALFDSTDGEHAFAAGSGELNHIKKPVHAGTIIQGVRVQEGIFGDKEISSNAANIAEYSNKAGG